MSEPITPKGGATLTPEQAAEAIRDAMKIIECVGWTGIERKGKAARDWMRKYFPKHAESGDW